MPIHAAKHPNSCPCELIDHTSCLTTVKNADVHYTLLPTASHQSETSDIETHHIVQPTRESTGPHPLHPTARLTRLALPPSLQAPVMSSWLRPGCARGGAGVTRCGSERTVKVIEWACTVKQGVRFSAFGALEAFG
jgi:hypothetical protein